MKLHANLHQCHSLGSRLIMKVLYYNQPARTITYVDIDLYLSAIFVYIYDYILGIGFHVTSESYMIIYSMFFQL